jgi:hypothetical protein
MLVQSALALSRGIRRRFVIGRFQQDARGTVALTLVVVWWKELLSGRDELCGSSSMLPPMSQTRQ